MSIIVKYERISLQVYGDIEEITEVSEYGAIFMRFGCRVYINSSDDVYRTHLEGGEWYVEIYRGDIIETFTCAHNDLLGYNKQKLR